MVKIRMYRSESMVHWKRKPSTGDRKIEAWENIRKISLEFREESVSRRSNSQHCGALAK